ncbi:hypothetical protein [Sphingomonas sp. PP-F2F-A104-K0414]|uniref:hypothetical protein n=1 Tax=Sphingomonas sp. PP-F2F-A104-K0414 TaxID=2135661 RepID=UPI0014054651|nr:hypothetical protein [Sphingomonas sp. PP-F2F-A104-K0414]
MIFMEGKRLVAPLLVNLARHGRMSAGARQKANLNDGKWVVAAQEKRPLSPIQNRGSAHSAVRYLRRLSEVTGQL